MENEEQRVGYVIRGGGRDTLGLLWTCMVAICLCTWTVQRPNVVGRESGTIGLIRKKAFWMCLTIFCPEYVAYVAINQWLTVRKVEQVKALGYPESTIVHAFYVEMGGVVIRTNHEARDDKKSDVYTIYMADLLILLRERIIGVPDISLEDLKERSKTDNFARFITF